MIGSAKLDSPLVASENWYNAPAVYDGTGAEMQQEWHELLELRAREQAGGTPMETARLKRALARGGIPKELRARVWLAFSGAGDKVVQQKGVYEELCERVAKHHAAAAAAREAAAGDKGGGGLSAEAAEAAMASGEAHAQRVLEQVEKDLRRTEVGADTEGKVLSSMRRVLCAFASFQPDVGYVQGMNFIVVALLRVLDEPSAFWLLTHIVQVSARVLPLAPCAREQLARAVLTRTHSSCVCVRACVYAVCVCARGSPSAGVAAGALLPRDGGQPHRLPRPLHPHL
jgi:hypothetical protein